LAWWNPKDVYEKAKDYVSPESIRKTLLPGPTWTYLSYKKKPDETALAAAVVGTVAGGPTLGTGILGAHYAVKQANEQKKVREDLRAAASERAQQPALFYGGQGIELGGGLEFEAGDKMKSLLPFAIVAVIAFYIIFKD